MKRDTAVSTNEEDRQFLEHAIEAVTWNYFFEPEDRRKIIDYIISVQQQSTWVSII